MPKTLSATVGDPKSRDPKPANKKEDIELLEVMLIANGYPLQVTGKMSATLVKTIRHFQKNKGKAKDPSGVIDARDPAWAKGYPKFLSYYKDITSFEAYEVIENGKKKMITVDEYMRMEADCRYKMERVARNMFIDADQIDRMITMMHNRADGSKGYVNALVHMGVSGWKGVEIPSAKPALEARAAAMDLENLVKRSKVDWKKVNKQQQQARKLLNKATQEWKAYEKKYVDGAEKGAVGATIVREGSFAVLECLATAYLVTTRGMPIKQAEILAAAGCEGLKVGAGEIGEYAANDKVDIGKSAANIVIAMNIAGTSKLLGGAIGGKFISNVATRAAGPIARKFASSRMPLNLVLHYVEKVFTSQLGAQLLQNGIEEAVKLAGGSVKDGTPPDLKKISESAVMAVTGGMLGAAPLKALKRFDDTWPKRALFKLSETVDNPARWDALRRQLVKHYPTDVVEKWVRQGGGDAINDTVNKVRDEAVKTGVKGAFDKATGTETKPEDLQKLAEKALEKDKQLHQKIDMLLLVRAKAELKKTAKAN